MIIAHLKMIQIVPTSSKDHESVDAYTIHIRYMYDAYTMHI